MVSLFEVQDGKIVLNEICHTSKTLKEVMKVFKKDKNYLKVYLALFYITCPDPKRNPFWDVREDEKQDMVIKEIGIDFSLDEPAWDEALNFCVKLYTTPYRRVYLAGKIGLDRVAGYIEDTKITGGEEGSAETYMEYMSKLARITNDFGQLQKAYDEEVQAALRGGAKLAYDETQ